MNTSCPFVPEAASIDQDKDRRLASVAKILAECTTVHAVGTWLMQNQPWDFMAVYYDAIDHFCHGFMKYHPPRQEHVPEKDFELFRNVVNAGYIYHDMMLATLLQMAGEDTTVILMSDHGFHPDHLRPKALPLEPAGPAAEHRDLGIFVAHGPGIRQDALIAGPNLLDIAPTVLTLFGLPVGEDMDGKPILDAFEQPPKVEAIPSWDDVEGDAGTHPPNLELDAEESKEAVNQLVALGYIEAPDENKEKAIAKTDRELQYNLALAYMDDARHGAAAEILEDLYHRWPNEHRYGVRLANCYLALDRIAELRSVVEDLSTRRKEDADAAREELFEFRERIKERLAKDDADSGQMSDGEAAPEGDEQEDPLLKSVQELTEAEKQGLRTLRSHAAYNPHWIDYLWGSVHLAEGSHKKALESFRNAEKAEPNRPGLHLQLGEAYLRMRQPDDAESCYRKATEIDPENGRAWLGMARCHLQRGENERSAELARDAIGLLYSQPYAHFVLGVALHRMNRPGDAVSSLETALSLNPNFPQAHRRLSLIHRFDYKDRERAREHGRLAIEMRAENRRRRAEKSHRPYAPAETYVRQPLLARPSEKKAPDAAARSQAAAGGVVTVVTGLPRSGTSMLMQMLQAGGMDALTDGVRSADEDNPRGYFEFEGAKRLQTDRSWVGEAVGKSVKVVAQLLPYLPPGFEYRIMLVHRDLDEILRSQAAMLERQGKEGAQLSDGALKNVFAQQIERMRNWLQRAPYIQLLEIQHSDVIGDPSRAAARIEAFIAAHLDADKMAAAVQPSLYRQRGK